jgi:small subunit ribosomal protein S4
VVKRAYGPGSHGASRRSKKSEYGLQLQAKQLAKAEYGLRERQFSLTFEKAAHSGEATGSAMMKLLETRLDNVVYRVGWASSRSQARQLVNHGHIKVNDKIVDIPSYQVKVKDIVEPADVEIIKFTEVEKAQVPAWLKVKANKAEVANLPSREEIDTQIDEQLVVEFYSK